MFRAQGLSKQYAATLYFISKLVGSPEELARFRGDYFAFACARVSGTLGTY